MKTTSGGAGYTLDTTGVPSVINSAIAALRPAGTYGLVGLQHGDLVLGWAPSPPGRP